MNSEQKIVVIGTSHIAKESIHEIKRVFLEQKPDVVCVELDKPRLIALLQKSPRAGMFETIRAVGLTGFFFSLLGDWAEKKLGKIVGVRPGEDMVEAAKLAIINKVKLALVDQDVRITLRRINKELTLREKLRFVKEIIKGLIFRKPVFEFDLTKVPKKELIKKMIIHLEKNYPSLYKTLVVERNEYMAKKIKKILEIKENQKVLVVVGAGHKEGLEELLKIKR
ncbi:hypothetical protein GOV05_04445 [Candidatus Woesearchaeota archaeon]|nr:hypothetical protein [Candidatus Woesearchaeota archaeon]